jgi:hypothetical protein
MDLRPALQIARVESRETAILGQRTRGPLRRSPIFIATSMQTESAPLGAASKSAHLPVNDAANRCRSYRSWTLFLREGYKYSAPTERLLIYHTVPSGTDLFVARTQAVPAWLPSFGPSGQSQNLLLPNFCQSKTRDLPGSTSPSPLRRNRGDRRSSLDLQSETRGTVD